MKATFNTAINIVPFFIWIFCFYLALMKVETYPDIGMIQIFLLLCLPLLYSIYNVFFSKNKNDFLINSAIFCISHIIGFCIEGALYYNYISSDSETIVIINTFSIISIVYILIVTLVFYGIRAFVDKVRNK